MSSQLITKSISISSVAEHVWHVLTDEELITQRAAPFMEGTHAKIDWKQGGDVNRYTNDDICVKGKIVTLESNKKIVTQFYGCLPEGGFTEELIEQFEIYELNEENGKTTLHIEAGPFDEDDRQEWGEQMVANRDEALRIIKNLAEENA